MPIIASALWRVRTQRRASTERPEEPTIFTDPNIPDGLKEMCVRARDLRVGDIFVRGSRRGQRVEYIDYLGEGIGVVLTLPPEPGIVDDGTQGGTVFADADALFVVRPVYSDRH